MVKIDQEKCVGCGVCAVDCIALNIEIKDNKACMLLGYPARTYARPAPRREANVIWK